MRLKVGEVLGEMGDFVLEVPLTGLGVAQLQLQRVDSPRLLGLYIQQHVNLHLHLVLLSLQILKQRG